MKKYTITIILTLICIVGLPLFIDWAIIGNNFPSNISNSDWVGFLGGYIGTIVGAIFSLVGVIFTIRFTREQNQKDRESSVRPYCTVRQVLKNHTEKEDKILAEIAIGCQPEENNGPQFTNILYIKNVGIGPAIEFEFDVDELDDGREHYGILLSRSNETLNRQTNLLQPSEEAALPYSIWFNFDPIREDDLEDTKDSNGESMLAVKYHVMQKYKNFHIRIHVSYKDIYENRFEQEIILKSNLYVSVDNSLKKAEHRVEMYLEGITSPKKRSTLQ